jgi:hypothetical protein
VKSSWNTVNHGQHEDVIIFHSLLFIILFPQEGFNFTRFLRMGAFGGLIHGPTGHLFYGFLERKFPGASTTAVVKKVAFSYINSA